MTASAAGGPLDLIESDSVELVQPERLASAHEAPRPRRLIESAHYLASQPVGEEAFVYRVRSGSPTPIRPR